MKRHLETLYANYVVTINGLTFQLSYYSDMVDLINKWSDNKFQVVVRTRYRNQRVRYY